MLSLRDVHVHIGKLHILQGVTLDVKQGESAALLGRNGAGKTSTLRAISGFFVADNVKVSGDITLDGRSIVGASPIETARPIELKVYRGGHMMYLRPTSRRAVARDMQAFYGSVLKGR
jgi:ABC-type branched-subunit amino acid transport system ATPase component